ncbi:MAG TPA: RluA family pseudouridine synthase [Candidatus Methylacidiphilales bacterium]|nr:RluA family pseudouridine synthase [Candidatus Methylacidiphilales bacterium]
MLSSQIVNDASELLVYLFRTWPDVKKKQVRHWLKFGAITVNDKVVTQFDHPLRAGDKIGIQPKGWAVPGAILQSGLRIVHEDAALLVIEKPAGLLTMASASESYKTAYAILMDHVRLGQRQSRKRVWIVHRLDRETSGLLVFAKNEPAKRMLQEKWATAEKKYLAVVEGKPPDAGGILDCYLDESDPLKVRRVPPGRGARRALTRYRLLKKGPATSLVELTLETGRRHQIRVQLADAGCPIAGDKKYGARTNSSRRLALHASALRFAHPMTGEEMRFVSALPGELDKLLL